MINLNNYINQIKKMLEEKVNLLKLKNELNKIKEITTFLIKLETDSTNLDSQTIEDNLLLLESKEEVEDDLKFIISLKEIHSFLKNSQIENTGIKQVILGKLNTLITKLKTKQEEKIKYINEQIKALEDIINKYTKLKNYFDSLETEFNLTLQEISEFMDLIELLDISLIEKLELVTLISQKSYYRFKNNQVVETSPITRENAKELIEQTETNEKQVLKILQVKEPESNQTLLELDKSKKEKIKEESITYEQKLKSLDELRKKATEILKKHQDILDIYYSFNDGIKHYLIEKDFESIINTNPNLNIEEIKNLALLLPYLLDLIEYMDIEIEEDTIDYLIEFYQTTIKEYQDKLTSYKLIPKKENDLKEVKDYEEFLSTTSNIVLFSKESEQDDFYINQDLENGDNDKQLIKQNELYEAIHLFTNQSYIDNIRIHANIDKLYKDVDAKLYDKELSPYRIRNTNAGRTGYIIIPTCNENMQKIADLYHNKKFTANGNGRIILFFSVIWTGASHNEYNDLNTGLYKTKKYIQKIKELFQNPNTDKKILQDIINESMEYSYNLIKQTSKDK